MLGQIAFGSGVMLVTVLLAALSILPLEFRMGPVGRWLVREPHLPKLIATMFMASLWLVAVTTLCVLVWATVLTRLAVFPDLEHAVYFTMVSFTTLGYGDVVLPVEWRLLGGMIAVNGLLNFGLMTAFMIETLRRLRDAQRDNRE
jgi:hypothetical protein